MIRKKLRYDEERSKHRRRGIEIENFLAADVWGGTVRYNVWIKINRSGPTRSSSLFFKKKPRLCLFPSPSSFISSSFAMRHMAQDSTKKSGF